MRDGVLLGKFISNSSALVILLQVREGRVCFYFIVNTFRSFKVQLTAICPALIRILH